LLQVPQVHLATLALLGNEDLTERQVSLGKLGHRVALGHQDQRILISLDRKDYLAILE